MRKVLILALALSLISGMAFADSLRNPSSHSDLPVIMDNGGPDTYGYYWEDNANHGSVPFNWMDLEVSAPRWKDLAMIIMLDRSNWVLISHIIGIRSAIFG